MSETVSALIGDPFVSKADVRVADAPVTNRAILFAGSLLLLLPNVLFAIHLTAWPAAVMLAGASGYLLLGASDARRDGGLLSEALDQFRFAACFGVALVLIVLGGEAHLAFANWDWLWRDAVLADVARAPFPPTYEVAGEDFFLRAPLGMYMLPAVVARAGGLGAGHAVLLVQNTILLTLALYLLATLGRRRAFAAVVVFVSFSGLDVLGQLIFWLKEGHGPFVLPSHIEGWIGLQYSSVITQVFWVPNHALPSYWLALLVLFCARGETTLGQLGSAMAAALFWSPFAVIGTLPFAAYLFAMNWRESVRCSRFWFSAAVAFCFVPVALYLRVDAGQVPHAFVLFQPFMISSIVLFLLIEIPHVWVVCRCWGVLKPWIAGTVMVAIAVLMLLPTMRFGVANDLLMRASIPALTILAFAFAQVLVASMRERHGLVIIGLALVLVGAITPGQEIVRALLFPPYRAGDCNLVTVWKKLDKEQLTLDNYLARPAGLPTWLMRVDMTKTLHDAPSRVCWPDLAYVSMERWSGQSNAMILHAGRDGAGPRL